MSRIPIAIFSVIAVTISASTVAEAQQFRWNSNNGYEYSASSRHLHIRPPVVDHVPQRQVRIDCSPTLGFFGEIMCDGLRVNRVIPGSEACRIGLEKGDIIIRANRQLIQTAHDWKCALDSAGPRVNLLVQRPCGRMDRLMAWIAPPRKHDRYSHFDRPDFGQQPRFDRNVRKPVPQFDLPRNPHGRNEHRYDTPCQVDRNRGAYNIQFGKGGLRFGFSLGR